MKLVKARVKQFILSRRRQKLSKLYEREYQIRHALHNMNYRLQPDDYEELESLLHHYQNRATRLAQKL